MREKRKTKLPLDDFDAWTRHAVERAERAATSGRLDVEVRMALGYLLRSRLSEDEKRRIEDRLRFLLEERDLAEAKYLCDEAVKFEEFFRFNSNRPRQYVLRARLLLRKANRTIEDLGMDEAQLVRLEHSGYRKLAEMAFKKWETGEGFTNYQWDEVRATLKRVGLTFTDVGIAQERCDAQKARFTSRSRKKV